MPYIDDIRYRQLVSDAEELAEIRAEAATMSIAAGGPSDPVHATWYRSGWASAVTRLGISVMADGKR